MNDAQQSMRLDGKDWFNVAEAAFYCGVSESQFRKNALAYGLTPRRFMGKQLYERAELYKAIYEAPTWSAQHVPQLLREAALGVIGRGRTRRQGLSRG